ncbi:MAG: cupin-like domain-containing protein, partial [Allosphingosinicella sp.]
GAADHQAKLRVKPFRNADGSVMEPDEAETCPVRHGAAPLPQPAARNVLLADPVGTGGLDPGANPALALALNRIGFDAKPQARPAFEAPAQAPAAELTLKQRDWIMQAAMRQRQLSSRTAGVPRVRDLSGDEFLDHFYALSQPVVIEDAMATAASDPATLTHDLGRLAEYLASANGTMSREEIGNFTPLRFAPVNLMIAQVSGAKLAILAPPSETGLLYHRRDLVSDVLDIADEERLAAFPLAREAMTFEVDLQAGDVLFLPIGWWHQTTALDAGAAVAFTDFRWPNEGQAAFPKD